MKTSVFLAFALNISFLAPVSAQTPPQRPAQLNPPVQDEIVRVTTNLVQVDAVVTDKNGKPVTDLRAEDFEILEDGKPQKISNLSYISTEPSSSQVSISPTIPPKNEAPAPAPVPARGKVRRTIVFAIDDLGISNQSLQIVKQALKRFVEEAMQPDDLVAIVRTRSGSGALQRFTTDKRQLNANIDSLRWECLNRAGPAVLRPSPCPPLPYSSYATLAHTLRSLSYIVEGLKTLPGRKSMILFTDSFAVLPNPADLTIGAEGNKPTPGATPTESVPQTDESRSKTGDVSMYFDLGRGLIQLSNQASVVIYAVDARGLVTTNLRAEEPREVAQTFSQGPLHDTIYGNLLSHRSNAVLETQLGLQELAHQTGGFAIINNNDLGEGVTRIVDDLKGYYLIGYRPSDSTFEKRNGRTPFHTITIKLKRSGLSVRSRKGFYGVPDETRRPVTPQTREQRMVAALESPFAAGDVRIRLTTLFGNVPQGSLVRTLIHIDARDLTFTDQPDGWRQANFDVLVSSYGENGLIADYLSRTETIRARGKTYANMLHYGLNYSLLVPIKKPGPYQLRTAVRDTATNRTGSAYEFIEVPDLKKGRLSLSGIALSSTYLDLAALSLSSGVYNAPPDNGDLVQPTPAVRRFIPGMTIDYRYVIYNALPSTKNSLPELTAQVRLFRDGEMISSKEEPASDSSRLQIDLKRLSAKGNLQLGDDLIPGNYVLQIIVTDPRAKEQYGMASQWIDFEVVK